MDSRSPTQQEMQELAAYLSLLYADGFQPVVRWHGGVKGADGTVQLPWPEYHPLVEQFYRLAASKCWLDYGYNPDEAARMLKDEEAVKSASLPEIKSMLTFCVRGERFSDGHWADMIENGSIRRMLERIIVLSREAGS